MTEASTSLRVDVWADVVCPWCYIGESRLERAAAALDDVDVTIVPHAFELDPSHSHPEKILDMLARKYGRTPDEVAQMDSRVATLAVAEGLPYTSDRLTANTFDAHRLVAAAAEFGLALEVLRALQKGHFSGELDLSDTEALVTAVAGVGLPEARAREVLAGDEFADAVREDQALARQLGVTGVPFTVVANRYAIPGAGAQEHYEKALRTALDD